MIRKAILFTDLIVLFTSCTPFLYTPYNANIPLPDHKNELKASFYSGTDGFGIQSSFLLDSSILIMGNGSLRYQSGYDFLFNRQSISNYQYDFGCGYFKKVTENYKFEILAGYGNGSTIESYQPLGDVSYYYNVNGKFNHSFIQGDLGIKSEEDEFDISLKFSNLFIQGSYFVNADGINYIYKYNLNSNALFLEPSSRFLIGSKHIKFNVGIGYSVKLFGPNVSNEFGNLYQNFYFSTGITVIVFREK